MPSTKPALGFTLIEVMVALAVLLIGMTGLLHLQLYGMSGNQGARAQMTAMSLANDLAAGIDRLDYADAHLAVTGAAGSSAPTGFGRLLFDATPATSWSDTSPIPGVTLDAALERDTDGTALYKRRWTVWGYADGTTSAVAKIVAVSVVYRERGSLGSREALVYTQKIDTQNALSSAQAFR